MKRQDFSSSNKETSVEAPSMGSEEDTFEENKEAAAELTSILWCGLSVWNGSTSDLVCITYFIFNYSISASPLTKKIQFAGI